MAPFTDDELAGSPPKSLVVAFILLQLVEEPMHGYELMQRLTQCGLEHLDQGNLYRMLRQMEKDQLVVSSWDTSAAGPAKRLYELTEEGKKSLKRHAVQMERYQSLIQQFFNRYASMLNRVMPTR